MPRKCGEGDSDECYMRVRRVKNERSCKNLMGTYGNWEKSKTKFTTNHKGQAAGMLFDLEIGKTYRKNECKALVIYGPENDDSSSSSRSRSRVIGCGMLVPEGERRNYCRNNNNDD